jgi:hypothetical protein
MKEEDSAHGLISSHRTEQKSKKERISENTTILDSNQTDMQSIQSGILGMSLFFQAFGHSLKHIWEHIERIRWV